MPRTRGPFTRATVGTAMPEEEQRRLQRADLREWHEKQQRVPPCPVCLWPMAGWHPHHGRDEE